jgi:hypothetical protein
MDAANGTLTPPEPVLAPEANDRTPNKRKREDEEEMTKGALDEVSLRSVQTQKDILEILQL